MRSLVVDQASKIVGFAIVEDCEKTPVSFGVTGKLIIHGIVTAPADVMTYDRNNIIARDIETLAAKYNVDNLVVENTNFKQKNKAASNALGSLMMALGYLAKRKGLAFYAQPVASIKKDAAGNGRANKDEMIAAAMHLWGFGRHQIKDDNHADALCAAYRWLGLTPEKREKNRETLKGRVA